MRSISFLIIFCVLIVFCRPQNGVEHKYTEYKTVQVESFYPANYICSDETEAQNIVGLFIYLTVTKGRFPIDSDSAFSGFRPIGIKPVDFDSIFSFTNYSSGGYYEEPCRIETKFRNGKTIRFCFFNSFFDISQLHCVACPENVSEID